MELLSLSNTADARASDVVRLLEQDEMLAGSVMRLVSSPIYSGRNTITNLKEAVVRLGSRLVITRDTDPQASTCLVPPLLLQPLVENAVKHGVAQLVDGGTIRVAASRSGTTLTITLENPCDPERLRPRGVGLGLELLRKRLTNHYGDVEAVFAQEQSGQFRVEVRIPAVTEA